MAEVSPILEARGITRSFGRVTALRGADFAARPGEVSAIVGDNGAGKSTLIKIFSGALQPDGGTLLIDGKPTLFNSPQDARRHGIETVYQDLALASALDVSANLFLGREVRSSGLAGKLGFLNDRAMRKQAQQEMADLQIGLSSVRQPVFTLSGGQRQAIAVARATAWGKRVVIMDEPTAALGVRETQMVLRLIKRVRDAGTAVVIISHSMPEVFEVADRITILRLGRTVRQMRRDETTMTEVVAFMTGAAVEKLAEIE
ncbi:MAG: sugar transporter ATP-binding protein [Chloroflexi bacterium]|nr:sugar transporter ATP-binding protein [Chloroflexota bacterium]MDB5076984.1 sugar transporter ATP-binding protein [Chloroflexota bacterium]